ncbi:MAG: class IV adenylate cyclase [Vicinamibacteria bacterium]
MNVEREVKLRFADAAAARAAVAAAGARLVRARHLEDNLLVDDGAASLKARGSALRIRRTDDAHAAVLTYKGRAETDASGQKARPEAEVDVSSADTAQQMLLALGFAPAFRYQKYREVWEWDAVEIVVDETPVGVFVEIEGEADAIDRAARALGRSADDYLTASYAELFRAQGGRGDMVF